MGDVDVVDALRDGLAQYLSRTLSSAFSGVQVFSDWPTSHDIKEHTISVLCDGSGGDSFFFSPVVCAVAPQPTGPLGLVTFAYGRIENLPVTVECWSSSKPKRNLLAARMRSALNRPPHETIPGSAQKISFGFEPGLMLRLDNFFGTICMYEFEPVQNLIEGSDPAQTNEWRSTWKGIATMDIVDKKLLTLIKNLGVKIKVDGIEEDVLP